MEKYFVGLIEKYGIGGVALVALFFAIKAIVGSKWFSGWWSKLSDKFIEIFIKSRVKDWKVKTLSESDIVNHDLFSYVDFWIISKIPTFQFSTEYRTVVFRKYLTIFLRSYKNGLISFVKGGEYQNMDQSQLWRSLLELINRVVSDYEKECEESGIPKIIIHKMKSKNNDTITLTIDLIESISTSEFYQSEKNLLKMYSIMNIILSILESTISNSENVCNSINGQLKGLTMDGKKEP